MHFWSAVLAFLMMFGCSGKTWGVPDDPVRAKSGMVASAHPLASQTGVEVLQTGGNAVDAAVAAALTLGVVEPHASGIGGGGFMLIYLSRNRKTEVIDYREVAPRKASPQLYGRAETLDAIKLGLGSVAVPGTLAGLTLALKKFGTKSLSELIIPAARIAESGFSVSPVLSSLLKAHRDQLAADPAAARIFLKNQKAAYEAGEKMVMKDLAQTYRRIAEKGAEIFYRGEIAEALGREMESRANGWIAASDLAVYRAMEREAIKGTYHGHEIFTPPPVAGGSQIIELLNILEGFDMGRHNRTAVGYQLIAEGQKRVMSDRARYLGDMDFSPVPLDELVSKRYAAARAKDIHPGKADAKVSPGNPEVYGLGKTTQLCVVDREGNVVSLTQTINSFFGSGIVLPGTGILLNNEMHEFSPVAGTPNSIAPGKRPVSSMAPSLVFKQGRPYLAFGSAGATRIISAMTQVFLNLVHSGMNLQQAINAPRIHWEEPELKVESRVPEAVRKELIAMGYTVKALQPFDLYFGGVQAIEIDPQTGRLSGAADPRRNGSAVGY